jgi:DNA replication and repair protein RecF
MTATLDTWDAQLARTAAPLLSGRMRLVAALRPHVEAAYEAVSGGARGEASGMNYRSSAFNNDDGFDNVTTLETAQLESAQLESAQLESALLKALAGARASELDRGVCLVGPHRDELELAIGGLPARGYASHGESWSMALALRLASFALLRERREDPVLILDDVFAELDAGRRDRLAVLVAGAEQVLITAAVPADVPAVLTGARFTVRGGEISSAG